MVHMSKLKEYHRKRDFKQTSEPSGRRKKLSPQLIFVIQKHAASHLHYDFRLELNGVLKSWAIPKGPSINPNNKRLAAHVEDHPLEYATFEGVIPANQYGGGTVMVWDIGTWEPEEKNPEKSYRAGKLIFRLHGKKLQGVWSLVQMKGKAGDNGKNWLLIKKMDDAASTKTDVNLDSPSALTGRSMQEIDADATKGALPPIAMLTGAHRKKFPDHVSPELCTLAKIPPLGDEWLHEIKFDGYRIISFLYNSQVHLMTRNQLDWTDKFSAIAQVLKSFPTKSAILDGELVVLDKSGRSNFQLLQNALQLTENTSFTYYLFDILYYQGYDLTKTPLLQRKKLLAQLIKNWHENDGAIQYSDYIRGHGKTIQQKMCGLGMEGVVSKYIDSLYQQKRTHDWVKTKCLHQQEFVIGGYTEPAGTRKYFGSLLLGYYEDKKQLIYCGHVGTGFNVNIQQQLYELLTQTTQTTSPFINLAAEKHTHWVKPKLVAEIKFIGWTDDNLVRQASFLGLRRDKNAKNITLEKVDLNDTIQQHTKKRISAKMTKPTFISDIEITHPEKLLYQNPDITKADVIDYYENIAALMLPYIVNRPLTLLRCPKGSEKKCFYQKHITETLPKSVYTATIRGEKEPYIFIKDFSGLIALVQMDVLEIHPWGSKIDNPEKPDHLIFDLDPDINVSWQEVITTALSLRKLLTAIGLESFLKTTGGKGLHVTVPIVRRLDWHEITSFTKKIAEVMEHANPEKYIAIMSKKKRSGKIFIDYLRNTKEATAIAPYSIRARHGAPIATPVSWDELTSIKAANQFTILNIQQRLKQLKHDPWQDFFNISQSITKNVIHKLESLKF